MLGVTAPAGLLALSIEEDRVVLILQVNLDPSVPSPAQNRVPWLASHGPFSIGFALDQKV